MNKKKNTTLSFRQLTAQYETNGQRLADLADLCERESRTPTDAEQAEIDAITREQQIIRMKIQAYDTSHTRAAVGADADTLLRENLEAMRPVTIALTRDIQTTAALEGTGIIPVSEQEMLKPVRQGLIYDKVGLNVRTGLSGGKLRWASHTKAVASFADEGERLTDSKIDFSKLDTKPHRMGIAVPVTREELESSQGIVESVVREEMPKAIVDLVNDAMFTTSGTGRKVYGPFVEAAKTPFEFAAEVPTRKELLKMKAKVAGSGLDMVAPCWVMTEAMKAELEDVKVDAGSGRFVCENDHILGYPVFTTPSIGEGNIGFGDWSYQAAGFFGPMNLIVDPYTLARNNATDFVCNGHFATVTLAEEAFVLGHKKSDKTAGTSQTAGTSDNG